METKGGDNSDSEDGLHRVMRSHLSINRDYTQNPYNEQPPSGPVDDAAMHPKLERYPQSRKKHWNAIWSSSDQQAYDGGNGSCSSYINQVIESQQDW